MLKRRILLIGIPVAVVAVVALVMFLARNREPEYGGKKLSEWIGTYQRAISFEQTPVHTDAATDAIRHIGTNAIPYLLKWIRYEPPHWETRLNTLLEKVNPGVMVSLQRTPHPDSAAQAFQDLGPQAAGAIPELTQILNDPETEMSARCAAHALGYLGPRGLEPLLIALTNQRPSAVRLAAAEAIEGLGTNALPAVPALLECLKDNDQALATRCVVSLYRMKVEPSLVVPAIAKALEDPRTQFKWFAIAWLGRMRGEANLAVPALVKFLSDADRRIREDATNALRQIDPKALDKVTAQ